MPASLFKQLLLPLYPRLQRVALRLLGNAEDAEDMVQEVYMKLWSKRDALPDVQDVEAYCVTLTKNMCIDRLRMAEMEKADVDEVPTMLAATDDVEAQVERHDAVEQVKQIIETLPEHQQQVITLRDMEDCSFEEIAEQTGLTAVNIRMLLSRARRTIRERFKRL
ncbi:MAG: sigma-70 family RNA polymerase sigma factor [Bacteroidaceae bacterium]|nr:sigma-70 family RNA polymerase sigma factor [Bacteroidaceae bacterium]